MLTTIYTMMSCRIICRNVLILFIALDKKTTIKSDCDNNNKENGSAYVSTSPIRHASNFDF